MNLRNIISIIFLLTGISNIAGQITETMLGDITGRQIGPSRMSGRISCIDAQKKNPNIVWVGAAGGGVVPLRSGIGLLAGTLRHHARRSVAGAVPGHDRRI